MKSREECHHAIHAPRYSGRLGQRARGKFKRKAAPDNVKAKFPLAAPKRSDGGQFKAVESYGELMGLVKWVMG